MAIPSYRRRPPSLPAREASTAADHPRPSPGAHPSPVTRRHPRRRPWALGGGVTGGWRPSVRRPRGAKALRPVRKKTDSVLPS